VAPVVSCLRLASIKGPGNSPISLVELFVLTKKLRERERVNAHAHANFIHPAKDCDRHHHREPHAHATSIHPAKATTNAWFGSRLTVSWLTRQHYFLCLFSE
jgi:hypothetical protein